MKGNPTVASVIASDLAGYGARRCFGLLGTANFKVSHALVQAGVELISARHECNAASMADAYAKATGELTLVGPGARVVLEMYGRWPKGVRFSKTPKETDAPALAIAGSVLGARRVHEETQTSTPSPSLLRYFPQG